MNPAWFFLNHPLDIDTPAFGGSKAFNREHVRSISHGDSSNSEKWSFNNHVGSHVDAPRHFRAGAATISDFPAGHWVFDQVKVLQIAVEQDGIIGTGQWCDGIPAHCDLLLIKTGFEAHRTDETYWKNNPGISPELANWLRANRPSVRAIGFDFISLTAFQHRALGREAHHAFLSHETLPILIFEDLKLSSCRQSPAQVIALPLLVKHADGAPVTILGRES